MLLRSVFIVSCLVISTLLTNSNFLLTKPLSEQCVFNNLFGEVPLPEYYEVKALDQVEESIDLGVKWLLDTQLDDGGWSSEIGQYHHNINNKAQSDPATTAMVGMALLRSGLHPGNIKMKEVYSRMNDYLLNLVESTPPNEKLHKPYTQIQRKLGENIDIVMATQFLTNLLDYLPESDDQYKRIYNTINKGVDMIQTQLDENGKVKGAGWAGVLQSSFASNALEMAEAKGAWVDKSLLDLSQKYQSDNYNPGTGEIENN